jgi:hypothetical protein
MVDVPSVINVRKLFTVPFQCTQAQININVLFYINISKTIIIFAIHVHMPKYSEYWVSFPEVKRPGRGVDHPPHQGPKLKKEYSYTSTPLGIHCLF